MRPLSKRYIISSYIAGLVLIIFFACTYFTIENEREQLTSDGQICEAIIIQTVNRKRGLDVQYKYVVAGKTYTNWQKVYKDLQLGDAIEIFYLPKNPAISRPVTEIKEGEK